MDHLNDQRSGTNQVNNLCQSTTTSRSTKDSPCIPVINSSTSSRKSRSKWRPEVPEVNWQDCFCICFFFYLLCSDTESEKRRKSEKKAEKEMIKRRKNILKQQKKEKEQRIKEMIKEREQDDGEKKVKSKRKIDQEKKVKVEEVKKSDHVNIRISEKKVDQSNEMRIEKRPVNCESTSKPINQIFSNQQSTESNKINNLDSTNLVPSKNPIIINWNDLN